MKKKATQEAGQDLLKFVDGMKGKTDAEVKKEAEKVVKKHGLDYVMYNFKPRERGYGLGVGAKGLVPVKEDGIEYKIKALGETKIAAADLAKQSAALVRMCEVAGAISEMAAVTSPPKAKPGTPPGAWATLTADMKKGSKELLDAVKSGKPEAVQKAANNLDASCTACHAAFR
jgi:hypothetical protein